MNRRALLLAGGSAALLAGCRGRDDDSDAGVPASETSERGDRELLAQLISGKREALEVYVQRYAPPRFPAIEREHLRRLTAAYEERGGRPEPPSRMQIVAGGREEALERMLDAEFTSVARLIDVIPKLAEPELRALAAEMLVTEAAQLAVLREEAGSPPLSEAFVYGARVE